MKKDVKHNPWIRILQGRFMNHPLHPLFVHLPVGLWIGNLVCDILYMINGSSAFAAASYYMILLGLFGVLFAIPTGLADYFTIPQGTQAKRIASAHMSINLFVTICYILNFFSRHGLEYAVPSFVTRGELALSVLSILLLGASGYLGGLLVYQHGVGLRGQRGRTGRASLRRVA